MSVRKQETCYHTGCGKKYDPEDNPKDACRYHAGEPFFHDAYKGWICCNKKCTDFTEFLNIPGCTISNHSNVRLPQQPKPVPVVDPAEVIEVKPIVVSTIKRPPFNTPMIVLKPEIAAASTKTPQLETYVPIGRSDTCENISLGTHCKNGGCTATYNGPQTNESVCYFHPGYPVFHEGLKYWSCCQKRTSDFNTFLNQVGCKGGEHLWISKESDSQTVQCRWDWHQTGNFVVLTVYAKDYCPDKSIIKLNPIRVYINLVFPPEDYTFTLDLELAGVVDVEKSQGFMFSRKVELKLKKKEPGNWTRLDVPKSEPQPVDSEYSEKVDSLTPQIDAVDLSDL